MLLAQFNRFRNSLGRLFTYQSETPLKRRLRTLNYMSCRQLYPLAGTTTHYSKQKLIQLAIQKEQSGP